MTYPTISIITATYNAGDVLSRLINSLVLQSDQNFEWVVADGGSTDSTMLLLEEAKSKLRSVIVDSRPDRGISDAINRSLKLVKSEYYLIAGADDYFDVNAVAEFRKCILRSKADIISAKVKISNVVHSFKWPQWVWLYGAPAKICSTSIGCAFKKTLHDKYGYYDLRYPIYADGLFCLRAVKGRASISYCDFVAGEFVLGGISNSNPLASYCEELRAKVSCGFNLYVQLSLFIIRVIKSKKRITHMN